MHFIVQLKYTFKPTGYKYVYILFMQIKFTFSNVMKPALLVLMILAFVLEGEQRIKADQSIGIMSDSSVLHAHT